MEDKAAHALGLVNDKLHQISMERFSNFSARSTAHSSCSYHQGSDGKNAQASRQITNNQEATLSFYIQSVVAQ